MGTMTAVLTAVHRVLRPTGLFLSISFAQPHFRVPLLLTQHWSVQIESVGDGLSYFCYMMRRGETPDMAVLDRYLYARRGQSEAAAFEDHSARAHVLNVLPRPPCRSHSSSST